LLETWKDIFHWYPDEKSLPLFSLFHFMADVMFQKINIPEFPLSEAAKLKFIRNCFSGASFFN
jgi:hypothetical protein